MSKLKQALQLHRLGYSNRSIASSLGMHKDTVNKYIRQFTELSLSVDELLRKDDPELERLFNAGRPAYADRRFDDLSSRLPYLQKELGRKHVTRYLLWEEYIRAYPQGYGFTQFCFHLKQHLKASPASTVLAGTYTAGEKVYIDFAGDTMEYVDRDTGEVVKVQTFVACLPYTDYGFAMCVPSQKSEDFIYALTRMFAFFEGVPRIVIPDNLKAAVTRSDPYEPEINRLMEQAGNHYGFVTIPARPAKPKDKSLVENQVKLVYNRVYAPLRNRIFFSLEELNEAVREQVRLHNRKRMQQRTYSREEHFVADEKQALKPPPDTVFEIQYDTELTVSANCCVYLGRDKHYYSVPYQHIGRKVKVIYTRSLVKIYLGTERVATHVRVQGFGYTMKDGHLASNSKAYTRRSGAWYVAKAKEQNPLLGEIVEHIFASSDAPPEFFYKRCDGLLHLARVTPRQDMEEACRIAIDNYQYTYNFIKGVLGNLKALKEEESGKKNPEPDNHENIRGAGYYR
jgi:transposase